MDLAPAWMVAVILGREFAVTMLRTVVHQRGQTMPASPIGKVKMVAQVVAILVLILGHGHMQQFFIVGKIALWVATIAAIISAVDYYRHFQNLLSGRSASAPRNQTPPSTPIQPVKPAESVRERISA